MTSTMSCFKNFYFYYVFFALTMTKSENNISYTQISSIGIVNLLKKSIYLLHFNFRLDDISE